MKIAAKTVLGFGLLALGLSVGPTIILAATPTVPAAEGTAMPAPSAPPAVAAPKAALPPAADPMEAKLPDLSKPLPGAKKEAKNADKNADASGKVPESVKDVIKSLSTKTDDVTLSDLNAAREAIAKLDALIDIEKRLADLDKIRADREKEKNKAIVEAIPKSALMPPAYMPPVERPVERVEPKIAAAPPPLPVPPSADIIRIEGSNNRYSALVREGDSVRLVHSGDRLADGSVVLSVSTEGVELERNKIAHLSQVKDVQGVFGDIP